MGYKYMIHTCNQRRWYVNEFLIPSMLEQGIQKEDMIVMVDTKHEGVLISTMKSFDWIGRTQDWNDVMWHLQDDVLIGSDFKKLTDEMYGDIICGFCSRYDNSKRYGLVNKDEMWYSFPCIGIKNFVVKECAKWFFEDVVYNKKYDDIILSRKHADLMFRTFIRQFNRDFRIYNSNPNLVEHVDYLIGGSITNSNRREPEVKAYYWKEPDLVNKFMVKMREFGTQKI